MVMSFFSDCTLTCGSISHWVVVTVGATRGTLEFPACHWMGKQT